MANKKQYACLNCGSLASKWSGQCNDCGSWGTIEEEVASNSKIQISKAGNAQKIETLDGNVEQKLRTPTSIEELNRVLGGGLVAASAILIGGDPGIGKSTLLLQLCATLSSNGMSCLYITGEESVDQIKLRAQRLNLKDTNTKVLAATNTEDIISTMASCSPKLELIIIDSIQTMHSSALSSAPGTVSQIRACAHDIVNYTKQNNIITLIACHVTKEGQLAGPKVLEHMVDTVLYFEGDRNSHYRLLRSVKNRFGGVNEIGVFEMVATGLAEVSNPSELFLMDREDGVSGVAVFAGIEGSRPLLLEIQALIAPSNMPTPRRSVVGWDLNRLSMIIAVLGTRCKLNLSNHEVYLSIAGGFRITEPAADMAVAAALISAANNQPLPAQSIFFGEIGLSGEVRKVTQSEARIKEALKLGFNKVVCSKRENISKKEVTMVSHVSQLKNLL